MKKILLILSLLITSFAFSQQPASHSSGVRIGDPSGTSSDPASLEKPVGSAVIYWNATLGKFRKWDGTSWSDLVRSIDSATGLEAINEGNGIGWRLIGRDPSLFGNIGLEAIDFGWNSPSDPYNISGEHGATGDYSFNIGQYNIASGIASVTIGNNLYSRSPYEIALGMLGTDYTPSSSTLWNTNDRLLNIGGGGPNYVDKHDIFTILKNRQVGIGIDNFEANTTGEKLQVNGDTKIAGTLKVETVNQGTATDSLLVWGSDKTIKYLSVSDLKNIKMVEDYQDIPLQEGLFYTTGVYEIPTDSGNYMTGDNLTLEAFSIYRKKYKVILPPPANLQDRYIDYMYDNAFTFIGTIRNGQGKAEPNKIPLNYNSPSESKGSISFLINDSLLIDDHFIKIPALVNQSDFESISSSTIEVNGKQIDHYIGVIEHEGEAVPAFKDLTGTSYNSSLLGKKAVIRFKYDYLNIRPEASTVDKISGVGSKAAQRDTNAPHYVYMTETFDHIYDSGGSSIVLNNVVGEGLSFLSSMRENDADLYFTAYSAEYTPGKKQFVDNDIASVLPLGSNNLIRVDQTSKEEEFLKNTIYVTSRAETDDDGSDPLGTSYGFGVEFNEPTLQADLDALGISTTWGGTTQHQQSPATAIVAAKLKKIRDITSAPWDIVREAARETASNAGSYNIYTGFGVIDTTAAIAAIPAKLAARSAELGEYFESVTPFPNELQFEDKGDNTQVVKKDLEVYDDFLRLSTPYTDPAQTVNGSVIFANNARFTFGNQFQLWSGGGEGRLTLLSGNNLSIRDGPTERIKIYASTGDIETSGNIKSNKYTLSSLNTAPSSATDTGTTGEIRITSDYIYVCIATDTWVRAALNTWP